MANITEEFYTTNIEECTIAIDFNYKFTNTDKFRPAAIHFEQHKRYTNLDEDSRAYEDHWLEEANRCLYGYTAPDGDYITGFHYWYLNYSPILRLESRKIIDKRTGKEKVVYEKNIGFPRFFDYDHYFYQYVDGCIEKNKFGAVAKARDRGYSWKIASMLNRNYYLIPKSKGFVFTSDERYLIGDGTLTKCWSQQEFIDRHTPWSKKRQVVNQKLHRRASFVIKDEFGNKIESGYMSEIMGASTRNNPDKIRGIRGQLIVYDEAGTNDQLAALWQIARPSIEHDGIALGLMLAVGTGSTDNTDVAGLKELFYHPIPNNVLGIPNIWDEGQQDTYCGFFHPQWANLETADEYGNTLYQDKDGNTLRNEAREYLLEERRKFMEGQRDSMRMDRYLIERPVCPAESFLEIGGNIFPKKLLLDQLARIRTTRLLKNFKQAGRLETTEDGLVWVHTPGKDITEYPLRGYNKEGAIAVWEHPREGYPFGTYLISVDAYDYDSSTTSSLGSCFVYKRYIAGDDFCDCIVAEYTGRPETSDDFYEMVRRIAVYYNARILYENQNKGIYTYLLNKHQDYLLENQPDIIQEVVNNTRVFRRKGMHMTTQLKATGLIWLRDFLTEEYSPNVTRISRIMSEPLLQELVSYNNRDNFDRVSSMIILMYYLKEVERRTLKPVEEEEKRSRFLSMPLYNNEWYEQPEYSGEKLFMSNVAY
jgi:hypothetical protein